MVKETGDIEFHCNKASNAQGSFISTMQSIVQAASLCRQKCMRCTRRVHLKTGEIECFVSSVQRHSNRSFPALSFKSQFFNTPAMTMFFAFVALCLSGGAFAQIITSGPCPEVKLQNLDSAKILGKWYEQASFYALYENGAECGLFNYFMDAKNNMPIENYTFTSSVTGKEEFYVTDLLTPDPEEPARLLRKHPLSPIEGYSDVLVLGTDYDTWLAVFSCNDVCNMNLQYAWIVTREQVPDESALASAYAVMRQNNIDTSLLRKMEQKNCRK